MAGEGGGFVIIARAPFRISLIGGGTDYPAYYRRRGGAVISTAVDRYSYLAVHRLSSFYPHRFRVSYLRTELADSAEAIEHPLVRECLRMAAPSERLEITHIADLPGGMGLGSSSSFTVGLLHALHAIRGERPDPERLAEEAIEIERVRVGDAGGHQDQYAAAFGGWRRFDFQTDGCVRVRALNLSSERRAAFESALMLFHAGAAGSAKEALRGMEEAARRDTVALDVMRALVDRAEEALLSAAPLSELGATLDRAWTLKRGLAAGVSFPALDDAYRCARRLGAWGGKLLGAGGRGFLMLLGPPECHAAIAAALAPWTLFRVHTGAEGSRIVYRDET